MFKNMFRGLGVILGLIFIVGCASKGVEVRHYIEVKDRTDQIMDGNAGYVGGEPKQEDRSHIRKTRKTYVLEVSRGKPEKRIIIENIEKGMNINDAVMEEEIYESDNFIEVSSDDVVIPYIGGDEDVDIDDFEPSPAFTEYTVQKDDTLQKISKKFYDSFSQWPKIYEVNKDVIDDPDRIKPGIVIQIPAQ